MAIDDDLPEFVGADKTTPTDPKRRAHPEKYSDRIAPAQKDGLDEPDPAPRVAVYTPPKPGASHPKHAVLRPALRVDRAEADLTAAYRELTAASRNLRAAELAEADAEASLMAELPGPTPDELLRDHANAELQQRAANVAAGRDPDARAIPVHGNSVLDRNAAHRARPAPGLASSLRSSTIRRTL